MLPQYSHVDELTGDKTRHSRLITDSETVAGSPERFIGVVINTLKCITAEERGNADYDYEPR